MSSVATIAVGSAVAGSLVSSAMAPSPSSGGGAASQAADPFASQRPQYQTSLQTLMTGGDPATAMLQPGATFNSSDPSYAFRFNQGMAATNSQQAATGNLNSGNRMLALQNYGQQSASQEFGAEYARQEGAYSNQFSRLSQLSGANVGSPAAAGQIIAGQQAQGTQAAGALGSQVTSAVSSGLNNYMNPNTGFNTGVSQTPTTAAPEAFDPSSYGYGQ